MEHTLPPVSDPLNEQFQIHHIDRDLTLSILEKFNNGVFDSVQPVRVSSIPEPDGKQIIDMTSPDINLSMSRTEASARLEELFGKSRDDLLPPGKNLSLDRKTLSGIGIELFGKSAFGVLNGGSATSYIDEKKNHGFDAELFELYREPFREIAEIAAGKAKGITPAFTHPDGTPGPSFMELKMRALLIGIMAYQKATGDRESSPLPLFQMTSISNDRQIREAYESYRESPWLSDLISECGIDVTHARTGIQPLIAAYTHSTYGKPKALFSSAFGKEHTLLPLPGGHGQNFIALKEVYRSLFEEGCRFAWLGNVDNLGSSPDPFMLGYLALSGKEAAFEFSFKTAVDSKGGILVRDSRNRINCADIGPAVAPEEVARLDESGKPVLFNCASAIFDLEKLCGQIDHIISSLPTRFSDQQKDAGEYSQAEQVTWEVIGMMEDFLIFGVKKQERFLAAKLLSESLLTSGLGLDSALFPDRSKGDTTLRELGTMLHNGLAEKLSSAYGLKLEGGRWIPKKAGELL
jgi:hypothetical protein